MQLPIFYTFFVSLLICMGCLPSLRRAGKYFGILDQPGGRRVHTIPIARVGGIAISLGSLVPILIWLPIDRALFSYLVGALIMLTLGVWDDIKALDYKIKFGGQLLASLIVVLIGGITLNHLPFQLEKVLPHWTTTLLTVLFFVGVTNAVNFSDGLDGLAGGLCLLSFGGVAFLGYIEGEVALVVISISMMGALYGFLRSNTHPANIFMGDGGSQFLGFSLGTLTAMLTQPAHGDYNLALSLFILGLPVMDTFFVMTQRYLSGKSPFLADKKHFHHKLLSSGFLHSEAVIIAYVIQSFMIFCAYSLRQKEEVIVWSVYSIVSLSILSYFFLSISMRSDHFRLKRHKNSSIINIINRAVESKRWLIEKPFQILECGLFLFLTLSVFIPTEVPHDLSVVSVSLFAIVLIGMTFFRGAAPFLVRLGLYIGSAFIVYLNAQGGTYFIDSVIQPTMMLFFPLIALLVIFNAMVHSNGASAFKTTPLDYLIILIAILSFPFLEVKVAAIEIGLFAAKLITLFIAYELTLSKYSENIYRFGYAILWVFLALGFRGWIT